MAKIKKANRVITLMIHVLIVIYHEVMIKSMKMVKLLKRQQTERQ